MLDTKTYIKLTKIIFFGVGTAHVIRLLMGWPIIIGGWEAPMWVSIIGVVAAWFLAYSGYKLLGKKK